MIKIKFISLPDEPYELEVPADTKVDALQTIFTDQFLKNDHILINGEKAHLKSKLHDGDRLILHKAAKG